jgi:hypothetical protein
MSARVLEQHLTEIRVIADAIRSLPIRQLQLAAQTEEAVAPWTVKTITPSDRRAISVLAEAQRQLDPPTITGAKNG